MKVIAIMGSPKGKGAGYKIVRRIEEHMKALGDVDFEYLFLKDANLKQCTGCYTCLARGEDKCPLKDDRAEIERRLLSADGAILSTPMCVLNVSWLTLNFIARFAYANHRPVFHRLKVMSVVNMGGDSPKMAFSFMRWTLGGARFVQELGVVTPPFPQTQEAVAGKERAIERAAGKFYRACQDTSLPEPSFTDLFLFHARKKFFLKCQPHLPADYEYYEGRDYYYDTKINSVKNAVAETAVGIGLKVMKNAFPGQVQWPIRSVE